MQPPPPSRARRRSAGPSTGGGPAGAAAPKGRGAGRESRPADGAHGGAGRGQRERGRGIAPGAAVASNPGRAMRAECGAAAFTICRPVPDPLRRARTSRSAIHASAPRHDGCRFRAALRGLSRRCARGRGRRVGRRGRDPRRRARARRRRGDRAHRAPRPPRPRPRNPARPQAGDRRRHQCGVGRGARRPAPRRRAHPRLPRPPDADGRVLDRPRRGAARLALDAGGRGRPLRSGRVGELPV